MNYFEDQELNDLFKEWIAMRKSIKKPATEGACKIGVRKLQKLSGGDKSKMIELMENSIFHCWQGFWDTKEVNEKKGIAW